VEGSIEKETLTKKMADRNSARRTVQKRERGDQIFRLGKKLTSKVSGERKTEQGKYQKRGRRQWIIVTLMRKGRRPAACPLLQRGGRRDS